MKQPDYIAALNEGEPAHQRTAEIGETFADALLLLRRARYAAVAVSHGAAPGKAGAADWSYVRLPRSAMRRWLDARIEGRPAEALSLASKLTAFYDEELWLFVGAAPAAAARPSPLGARP